MTTTTATAIANAYDATLAEAVIDQDSIGLDVWKSTLSVEISGSRYTVKVAAFTVAGLKVAVANALGEHCTIHAALRVAKAS
jgi:hypothetical protein